MNYFKADGGRVDFQTGGALDRSTLNERGQAVYDSMKSARHTDQTIIDQLQALGLYGAGTDEGIASIVNVQPNIIDQGGGGGGGNEFTGPGKMYDIQQWGEFGPDKPGWKDATVEGWMTSTGPKTKEGKNIFHAGMFTGDPDIGDIKGTPIDWSKLPMGLWGLGIRGIKKVQDYWGGQQKKYADIREQKIQEEIKAANLQAAMDAQQARATSAADLANIQQIQQYTGQGLSDYRMDRPASERQYTGHGRSGMGRDPRDRMADGGLATMFERRR
jgi:hypothetical protein